MLVHNPSASSHDAAKNIDLMLDGLAGKVVGFIDNAKPNFHYLVDDLAQLLIDRYGVAAVVKRGKRAPGVPVPDDIMNELFERCDVVIAGSGD